MAEILAGKLPCLDIFQFSTYEEMIERPVEHYPYLETWEEAKDDKFLISHTSNIQALQKLYVLQADTSLLSIAGDLCLL